MLKASYLSSIIYLFLIIYPEVSRAETSCSKLKAQIIDLRLQSAKTRSAGTSLQISEDSRNILNSRPTNNNTQTEFDKLANDLDNFANQKYEQFMRNCPKGWQAY
jgi:hypothetical protein